MLIMPSVPNFTWPQVVALLGSIALVGGILVALVALGQSFGAIAGAVALIAGALGVQAAQTAGSRAEQRVATETVIRQTNGNTNDLVKQNATQAAAHSAQLTEIMNMVTQLAIAVPPSTIVDVIRPISAPPAPVLDGRVGS